MKYLLTTILAGLPLIWSGSTHAAIPAMLQHQDYVTVSETSFNGVGQFKFALVDGSGATSYWSHDGTSVAGGAPTTALGLEVDQGILSVLLGDTSTPGMLEPIPASVFQDHADVYVRSWFNDGTNGFQQLSPDARIASAGYAMVAATVADGAIKSASLAPNITLGGTNTSGTLTLKSGGNQTRAALDAGTQSGNSSLKLFDATGAFDTVRLVGAEAGSAGAQLLLKNGSGHTTIEMDAQNGTNTTASGFIKLKKDNGNVVASLESDLGNGNSGLRLFDPSGTQETFRLTGSNLGTAGALASLKNRNGNATVQLFGQETDDPLSASLLQLNRNDGKNTVALRSTFGGKDGGSLQLANSAGNNTVELAGDGGENQGRLILKHSDLANRVRIDADGPNNSGELKLYDSGGTETIQLLGGQSSTQGASINLHDGDGTTTVTLDADDGNNGGQLQLKKGDGTETARLQADIGSGNGGLLLFDPNHGESIVLTGALQGTGAGFLQFRNLAGTVVMTLNGDSNGEGRITTQVIEITGGSDLSESFDVAARNAAPEPGMIVCIDPVRPGELRLSDQPYDSAVAGVISGAGGVKPGMLMGQAGTRASGKHPVALTGRVYCRVDAEYGAVHPGDLITTSATPGHGMKAEPGKGAGAVVGKAMTSLESGRGLVLVLVALQ